MSGTQGSSAAAGVASTTHTNISVRTQGDVYIAKNIVLVNAGPGEDKQVLSSHDLEEDCGIDLQSETSGTSRWTQTSAFVYIGQEQNYCVADNYARIDMRFNEKAAKVIADGGSLKSIEDTVLKCLARLEWQGKEIHCRAMTAWRMHMAGNMDALYQEIIDYVREGGNRKHVCELIEAAFQRFGLLLKGIDSGSLIFIFQHVTEEGAHRMRSSEADQKAVQQMLLEFLPRWVRDREKEGGVSWEVVPCQSEEDTEVDNSLSELIPLRCHRSGNVASADYRHMEISIEKAVERCMQSVYHHFAQVQKQMNDLQDMMTKCCAQLKKPNLEQSHMSVPPPSQDGRGQYLNILPIKNDTESKGNKKFLFRDNDVEGNMAIEGIIARAEAASEKPQKTGQMPNSDGSQFYQKSHEETEEILKETATKEHSQHRGDSVSSSLAKSEPGQHSPAYSLDITPSGTEGGSQYSYGSDEQPADFRKHGSPGLGVDHSSSPFLMSTVVKHSTWSTQQPGKGDSLLGAEKPGLEEEEHEKEESTLGNVEGAEEQESDEEEDDTSTASEESDTARNNSQKTKVKEAEKLLNWVNVKTKASESKDPEIQRMMDQVELALRDEETEPPRARALDTVLVLDTSDSVVKNHLDELKTVAHTFIDGIEDNVDVMSLEENLAVVQMESRAWVRQHLTNDYSRVREAVDNMMPGSKGRGRTAMFQTLLVCLGAIEGRGGVVNVAGCHRVRPRLIFFTDGRPTDEATETGADTQSNISEVKFSLLQLISEFASKKHQTTPAPIFWVPIGSNPDKPFMESLAAVSGGNVVEKENVAELCLYYKMQETIGCVYKMVNKHKDIYETEQKMRSIVTALAGSLSPEEKEYVIEEVKKKQKDPENETGDADDFDNVFEDTESVSAGVLLPLGTRVVRGPHWKWKNQDREGPGTVIQHRRKKDGWLYVMWDNGAYNAYRFGDADCMDVVQTEEHPRILSQEELIAVGVKVRRGEDWKSGDEDGNGTGIVIRKRSDNKVKVRWENGFIGKYKYGHDGKMEVKVDGEAVAQLGAEASWSPTAGHAEEEEELLGAVGGYDPAEGPARKVWQWWDSSLKQWRTYSADIQDKLLWSHQQRADGSCVITRDGLSRRVLFKLNHEKAVDKGGGIVNVQALTVSELQYVKMLQEEEERLGGD